VALFEESLALYEEIGQKPGMARVRCMLGNMACDKGDYGQAGALLKESLALMQESKSRRSIASVLEGFAMLALAQQQATLAAQWLGAAEGLRETIGAPLPFDERSGYEQAVAAARTVLGEEAFASAWAQGRATPLEQTITDVLKMGGRGRKALASQKHGATSGYQMGNREEKSAMSSASASGALER
jgi:hypothetical protein